MIGPRSSALTASALQSERLAQISPTLPEPESGEVGSAVGGASAAVRPTSRPRRLSRLSSFCSRPVGADL